MSNEEGPQIVASITDLERVFQTTGIDGIEDAIYAWLDFDGEVLEPGGTFTLAGDLVEEPDGIEFQLGTRGIVLTFPFSLDDVEQVVEELEEAFEAEIGE